ncbi:MAG: exosortase-associated EpsI family protein [Dehalococcoidia bacterium]|nr:exosortase-associated EpsI family protein [Dehalococcoidia bacterium]
MDFLRRYSLILGLSTLIAVIVLLFSSSDLFFSSGATFISTELNKSSGNETFVKTRLDIGDPEHTAQFPLQMGDWRGYDYDTSQWEDLLGTKVMLMRGYTRPGVYQPIFFLISQSATSTSFHPPRVCYTAQGYNVREQTKDQVIVPGTDLLGKSDDMIIPVERMIVTKDDKDGNITERRVVLHFFVKGNQFKTNTITWIRMEALSPREGSYEGQLTLEKEFLSQAIPLMFASAQKEDWNPVIADLADWGVGGYIIIVLLLSIPLALIIFPKTPWGKRPAIKPEPEL